MANAFDQFDAPAPGIGGKSALAPGLGAKVPHHGVILAIGVIKHPKDRIKDRLSLPPDEAAHAAATSPHSDLPLPTEAQREAGNFQKGHTSIGGLGVTIEHPEGAVRAGRDKHGNQWMTKVRGAHYGYLKKTSGADGEQIDVFVKPGTSSDLADKSPVFVVDQVDPKTRKFDEHKALIGYHTGAEARQAYLSNFPKDWNGLGRVTRLSLAEFKKWLQSGNTSKAIIRGA